MATLIFDTHAFVKQLTEAGMPEPQAEVLARTQAALIDERLATKDDLQALELRLNHQIREVESRLKYDLTVRLGSVSVVTAGLIIAVLKLIQ